MLKGLDVLVTKNSTSETWIPTPMGNVPNKTTLPPINGSTTLVSLGSPNVGDLFTITYELGTNLLGLGKSIVIVGLTTLNYQITMIDPNVTEVRMLGMDQSVGKVNVYLLVDYGYTYVQKICYST